MVNSHASVATPLALADSGATVAVIGGSGLDVVVHVQKALGLGMDTLVVDEGFDADHEAALKRRARSVGRLVLGPRSGFSRIDGLNLGFAPAATAGPIGILSGSASAARQVTCLLDRMGVGVSQVLVAGGSDMSADVAGEGMHACIDRLRRTHGCHLIVALLWPAAPEVRNGLLDVLDSVGMPVVVWFPGQPATTGAGAMRVDSLEQAAQAAARMAGRDRAAVTAGDAGEHWLSRGEVRGFLSGGALCAEASAILGEHLDPVWSNAPAGAAREIEAGGWPRGHVVLDVGDPRLRGDTPHPTAEPLVQTRMIREEISRGRARVILLDVALGWAMHPDPAGALCGPISELREAHPEAMVIAHVAGTRHDPQGVHAQEERLRDAGVHLEPSNAAAARHAARLVTR